MQLNAAQKAMVEMLSDKKYTVGFIEKWLNHEPLYKTVPELEAIAGVKGYIKAVNRMLAVQKENHLMRNEHDLGQDTAKIDGEPAVLFRRSYRCTCGHEWQDAHNCACNDKCPVCNLEIEPYEVEAIGEKDNT